MGQAVKFPEQNDWIGKPEDMSNNQCYALPICRLVTHIPGVIERAAPQPVLAHVSCWEFTEEEMEEIIKNKKVYVHIIGTTLYPMSVHGKLPIHEIAGELSDHILTEQEINTMHGR